CTPVQPALVLVVINPIAGSGSAEDVRGIVKAAFDERGWRPRFYETTGSDDLVGLIHQAQQDGARLVVAAGGDGTIADVANSLIGTDIPLGIIPLGTGNVLSLDLGIPQDIRQAASLLVGPQQIRQLDAMRIGERHFILQIGVGIDSLMIRHTDRSTKQRYGRWAYMLTLFRQLGGYRAKQFRLRIDGRSFR